MNHIPTILKLFYLISSADGEENQKEVALGKILAKCERIAESKFSQDLKELPGYSTEIIYNACVQELKILPREVQVRYLAWIGLIANADGFMDKREWQLLYDLYHKELNINLHDILNKQRELAALINNPAQINN